MSTTGELLRERSAGAVSQPLMRRHNLSLALRTIWDAGEITRTQLAAALGLTKPAIGRIVSDLAEAGYITENEERPVRGRGRPSSNLRLRPGRHYFIGVDFRVDRGAIEARDLTGELLYDRHFDVARTASMAAVVASLAERLVALESELGRRPSGIGVSLPAEVSADGLTVMSSTYFDWHDAPFVSMLASALGPDCPPLQLDHIANCAGIANWREIAPGGARALAHMQVGVGAGLGYASREFPTGRRGAAARRFGHLPMDRDGPACRCGSRGCLDAVAGFDALVRYAAPCGIAAGDDADAVEAFCRALAELAARGSVPAAEAIATSAVWFARAAAIVINFLGPSNLTIGGYPLHLGEAFTDAFLTALLPLAPNAETIFTRTALADEASVMGAVLLGMHSVMTDPLRAG